jgi:AraC-like DNA-binding protein/NAD(P)H-dependent FMN reductase
MTDPRGDGYRILLLGGGHRRPSPTRCLLEAAEQTLVGTGVSAAIWDVGERSLPMHARGESPVIATFRDVVQSAHALVVATQLQHGSCSGVVKHALDQLSADQLHGKPVGLISTGGDGGPLALDHLRAIVRALEGVAIPCQVIAVDGDFVRVGRRYEIATPRLGERITELASEMVWFLSRLCPFPETGDSLVRPPRAAPNGQRHAHPEREEAVGDSTSERIGKAIAYLRANFGRCDLSLDMVARQAYMSRFHFSRVFKRETGVRFIDVLTMLRLSQASALLLETNHSITSICYRVGYNQLSQFERAFRKQFGTSPSAYRRNGQARTSFVLSIPGVDDVPAPTQSGTAAAARAPALRRLAFHAEVLP